MELNNLTIKKVDNKFYFYSPDYFQKEIIIEGREKIVWKQNKKYYWKVEIDNVLVGERDVKVIRFRDNEPNETNRHLLGLGGWIFLRHAWELEPVENTRNEWKAWMPNSFLKIISKHF